MTSSLLMIHDLTYSPLQGEQNDNYYSVLFM